MSQVMFKGEPIAWDRNPKTVKESMWKRIKEASTHAKDVSKSFVVNTVVPAVSKGTDVTLGYVDTKCKAFTEGEVEFLKKYPGIAMILAQKTVVNMVAAKHVEDLTKSKMKTSKKVMVSNQ
jgi:hypothetical protein